MISYFGETTITLRNLLTVPVYYYNQTTLVWSDGKGTHPSPIPASVDGVTPSPPVTIIMGVNRHVNLSTTTANYGVGFKGSYAKTKTLPNPSFADERGNYNYAIPIPSGNYTITVVNGTNDLIPTVTPTVTTAPDGTTVTTAPGGTTVTTAPGGTTVTTAPDGTTVTTGATGSTDTTGATGSTVTTAPDSTTVMAAPTSSSMTMMIIIAVVILLLLLLGLGFFVLKKKKTPGSKFGRRY